MAEVEILELLQQNDEHGVANVVHMKEHFHFPSEVADEQHSGRRRDSPAHLRRSGSMELDPEISKSINFKLIRLTGLQLCIIHCPQKNQPQDQSKRKPSRNRSLLYRKRCKMKARLQCLETHHPASPEIQKLKDNISLLQIGLRDTILEELQIRDKP
ncbi:unnamed protein product [Arctogadus glacialis]